MIAKLVTNRVAKSKFRKHGGMLRMAEAIRLGIHRTTLGKMLEKGEVELLARGLYRLVEASAMQHPDLVTVAVRVPKGVVFLLSALAFHQLTTHIPHEVCIAIPVNSEPPQLEYPPVRSIRVSPSIYQAGIETHRLDGKRVKIYSREKTLADCFKRRKEIGMDTMLEALKAYKSQGSIKIDDILHYAKICRVTKTMKPYLEAIL